MAKKPPFLFPSLFLSIIPALTWDQRTSPNSAPLLSIASPFSVRLCVCALMIIYSLLFLPGLFRHRTAQNPRYKSPFITRFFFVCAFSALSFSHFMCDTNTDGVHKLEK
ncbi:uncharacterized protein BYT42DRAFT_552888 [Radiomyces spectabilis]|uniref:uncharacterized protein n=1 Tax=Radiomyces spectabilis TaxID=64574 RepID=UPI0022211672|nr:uncharacterized protein BYT42DRAFT_552888 [Radiomyces spectabilis]KAI8393962.1 hypothetical protein BYT42DRAFT_552888 [Radiomyces spectabilis]